MADRIFSRPWWRKVIFGLLARLSSKRGADAGVIEDAPKRIMILAPLLLGDYLMLTPLIRALSETFPNARIAAVVIKTSYALAKVDPYATDVLLYAKLPGWFGSMARIFRFKPDAVILPKPHPAFTESILTFFSGSTYRIGLNHPGHNAFLTHSAPHKDGREHRIDTIVRLLEPFGIDLDGVDRTMHIGIDDESEKRAIQFFRNSDPDVSWISINLSASNPTRLWSWDKWDELLKKLHRARPGLRTLVLSAPAERERCIELARNYNFVETVATKSLLEAIALMKRTKLLLSPDTGAVHAAVASGLPVVVLFNSDEITYTRFAPRFVPHEVVIASAGKDVKDIGVEDVFEKVNELLGRV